MTIGSGGIASNVAETAFGEGLFGQLHPQFQGSFEFTVDNTDLNTNTIVNGGTITQADAMAVLTTSTTTASSAKFESKQHARYKSGIGGVDRFTSLFTAGVAGTEQYSGLADENGSSATFKNGYMVGFDGDVFGFHRFQNDTKISIPLADWDDPLDGSGPSGEIIDPTKKNVFFIQYQYLGGGPINVFREDKRGKKHKVLVVEYPGLFTEPSTHNPNFHHVMWVDNKATTANLILKSSSYAYFVEGKTSFIELHQPSNSSGEKSLAVLAGVERAIFTIRNKSAYAGKANFIDIVILVVGGAIEASPASNLGGVRLVKNATLGGVPSYSDINTTNSVVEIDTSATTVTGGKELNVFPLAGKNDKFNTPVIDLKLILNPGETLTFPGISSGDADMTSLVVWRELF